MSNHWDFVDACNPSPAPSRFPLPMVDYNKGFDGMDVAVERKKRIIKRLHEEYTEDSKWDDYLDYLQMTCPAALLEVLPNILTQEQFDNCIRRAPHTALEYVSERLTQEQFDNCIRRAPQTALEYVSERLTQEQFDNCIEEAPHAAVKYVSERLTQEQDYIIRKRAQTSMEPISGCFHELKLLAMMPDQWFEREHK